MNSSIEETTKHFQNKFENMIKEMTILSLPMQKKAYQCCVSCFDSIKENKDNPEKIAMCIERCHDQSQTFSKILQREVEGLQTSLESCQKICFNRLSPKIEAASSVAEKTAVEAEKDICFVKCFTDNLPVINEIKERLKKRL